MSCDHPIKALYHKPLPGEEKGRVEFLPLSDNRFPDTYEDDYLKVIFVPCNKCSGCTLAHSTYWANRVIMESLTQEHAFFVTLTYNDACCPDSVSKSDIQKFLKRLRRSLPNNKIRYFIGAEYGGKTARPHYHMILFGVDLFSFKFYRLGKNESGNQFYSSGLITDRWPFGFNSFCEANPTNIAYCCKYSMKKTQRTKFEKQELLKKGLVPEFALMSRKPALGTDFFLKLLVDDKLIQNGGFFYCNGKKIFLPKLFLQKLKESKQDDDLFKSSIDNFSVQSHVQNQYFLNYFKENFNEKKSQAHDERLLKSSRKL